jgi:ferredoxin
MLYVGDNLCAGCGICIDACPRDAISLAEGVAHIDTVRCTSCGQCVDVCPAAAIVDAEVMEPGQPRPLHPQVPTVASPDPELQARTVPSRVPSRLEMADKVLSGLLGVLAFALDRKQGGGGISRGSCGRGKSAHRGGGRGLGNRAGSGGGRRRRERQRYVR